MLGLIICLHYQPFKSHVTKFGLHGFSKNLEHVTWQEKLRMMFFGKNYDFTKGSNVGMVVTFVVVESSIVQSSNQNLLCHNLFKPSQKKNSNHKK
jgi:hypothetical protein